MKINRRDYLLRMGAGGAGFLAAGSPLFSPHAAAQYVETRGLRWPITNVPPPPPQPPQAQPFVTAIYCGLAQFAYHYDRFVQVAFHEGTGKHKLEIQIYKNPVYPYSTCTPERPPISVGPNDRFILKVEGQRDPNPNVFQVDCNPFDRNNTTDRYKHDFRWLPDFHGHDFYPEGYELNHVTGPRLEVHTGTFYTRTRSLSTFKIVDASVFGDCEDEFYDFGHIALYMATAINATRNGNVLLLDRNGETVYRFETNAKYQIVFNNECESCNHHKPDDCDEKKRNDFHFNRKVCKVPLTTRKYGLRIKRPCDPHCAGPDFCLSTNRDKKLNDEAPCSGAGYGKAPGIP